MHTTGRAIINLLVSGTLFSAIAACVNVDGGAVEASWVLRTQDGRAVDGCDCASPAIAQVRLRITSATTDGDLCAGRSDCQFSCPRQRGATAFFVPAGRYAVSVVPLGADGAPIAAGVGPGTVRVPAPILRDVVYGQATQFEAFAIEAGCAEACGGNQPTRACSRD